MRTMLRSQIRSFSKANFSLVNTTQYNKQTQLYLHEFSKDKTLVSFSSNPDLTPIGLVKQLSNGLVTPSNFIENKAFYEILHDVYSRYAHEDQTYKLDALNYPGSYMALGDYKIILDYMNQRPELANTIGFVNVNFDCEIVPDSYERNMMYNMCNIDGIITLSEFMLEKVKLKL